jgi:hypothetical protein
MSHLVNLARLSVSALKALDLAACCQVDYRSIAGHSNGSDVVILVDAEFSDQLPLRVQDLAICEQDTAIGREHDRTVRRDTSCGTGSRINESAF